MKKIFIALMMIFVSVNLASAHSGEIYKAEKKWQKIGRNPFKKYSADSSKQWKRDRQGLKALGLTNDEIQEVMVSHVPAVKKVQTGFRWDMISQGDRFAKVLFGNCRVWQNVVASWDISVKQAARVYSLSSGKEVWYPLACGNWALKYPAKEEVKEIALPTEEVKPAPPAPEPAKKEVFLLPPPPCPPLPPPPPPVIQAKLQETLIIRYKEIKYRWDWDSTWGGFKEWYEDGNKVQGWWQTSVLYPVVFDDLRGNEWSFGFGFTTRDWHGETGSSFHYRGDVDIWSLAGRFRDTDRDWELIGRLGLGQRKDSGHFTNQFGRYDMGQKSDVFNAYSSAEYDGRKDEQWFSKIRLSGEGEWGFNQQKKDYWTDQQGQYKLSNSPDSVDAYSFALYSDIYSFDTAKTLQIWGENRSTYYNNGDRWGNGLRGGLSFFNGSFKIGVGYTLWDKDYANSRGIYGELNLYNLYHSIFGYPERPAPQWDFDKIKETGYDEVFDWIKDKKEKGGKER